MKKVIIISAAVASAIALGVFLFVKSDNLCPSDYLGDM